MEKTVKDHLLRALDELLEESFKRFRNKLNDCTIKEGFEKIPRGKLQNKDTIDVTDLILSYYGDSYGIELTIAVLNAINEKQVAEKLQKAVDKESSASSSPSTATTSTSSPCSDPKHFVDEHQVALIEGVSLVAPILDRLMSAQLLTYEEYDTIKEEKTSYEQMRKLYRTKVRSWKNPQKDIFKNALSKTNPVLVKELEKPQH